MNTVKIQYPGQFLTIFPMVSYNSYENDLERIFAEWNHGSGMESELFINARTRSLSVNDFVCINDKWWQCISFGWKPVTQEFVDKVENAVRNHPNYKDGAWFALHDVMNELNVELGETVTL